MEDLGGGRGFHPRCNLGPHLWVLQPRRGLIEVQVEPITRSWFGFVATKASAESCPAGFVGAVGKAKFGVLAAGVGLGEEKLAGASNLFEQECPRLD